MKSFALTAFFFLVFTWSGVCAGIYGGGSGTIDYPYQISIAAHLIEMGQNYADWDKHFVLTDDIGKRPQLGHTIAILSFLLS